MSSAVGVRGMRQPGVHGAASPDGSGRVDGARGDGGGSVPKASSGSSGVQCFNFAPCKASSDQEHLDQCVTSHLAWCGPGTRHCAWRQSLSGSLLYAQEHNSCVHSGLWLEGPVLDRKGLRRHWLPVLGVALMDPWSPDLVAHVGASPPP